MDNPFARMGRRNVVALWVIGFGIALPGCSGKTPDAAPSNAASAAETPVIANAAPAPDETPAVAPIPAIPSVPPSGPAGFVPLQSNAVKDAIHRALDTGQTQRWQDGALSGYAVPSQTPGANGCRAVRYTVDQRPGGPYESITACDAH